VRTLVRTASANLPCDHKLNASHSNLGHGCPIEPTTRISVRKFLGKVNYKDVIYFSRAWTPDRTNGKNFRQEILEERKLQDVISFSGNQLRNLNYFSRLRAICRSYNTSCFHFFYKSCSSIISNF